MVSNFRKGITVSVVCFSVGFIALFFGFHTFAGDRGLMARGELDRQIILAQEELALLQKPHMVTNHALV